MNKPVTTRIRSFALTSKLSHRNIIIKLLLSQKISYLSVTEKCMMINNVMVVLVCNNLDYNSNSIQMDQRNCSKRCGLKRDSG